ncbi:MAG: hypothetical protein ANABAC_1122 [Anaerolineae bacterium]|nr:MAG: hypothetical protein ANABAC_1122 [Anaerolineae bacterium]
MKKTIPEGKKQGNHSLSWVILAGRKNILFTGERCSERNQSLSRSVLATPEKGRLRPLASGEGV